ncbi:Hypothetical predicted protein [Paramuricea clavata]|uniref:DNA 3'-5' helicase n=1 Tax=Paramuricea clavata TaxID=317549 RepID=A0A7D9IGV4_PARCT|nr:Hypothetical predicted protein [Paramuricea clavata]
MSDQIYRLSELTGIQASIIDVKELKREDKDSSDENMDDDNCFNVDIDFRLCEKRKLRDGRYHIVFAPPETLISSKYGRELLLSQQYQENVVGIVIDEAHCILDWSLLQEKVDYPLTIIYTSLTICGFAYKLFEHILGDEQYFPLGSDSIPSNRLFAQFHAPQTRQMKEEILKQLCSKEGIVRVVFATVAIGMGVDIRDIRQIIHIGPPSSVKAYFQETGRAGRDGKPSTALLYYNNRDIAKNRVGMQDDMRAYCASNNTCLRKLLLKSLDYKQDIVFKPLHLCCGVCEKDCDCPMCLQLLMEKL